MDDIRFYPGQHVLLKTAEELEDEYGRDEIYFHTPAPRRRAQVGTEMTSYLGKVYRIIRVTDVGTLILNTAIPYFWPTCAVKKIIGEDGDRIVVGTSADPTESIREDDWQRVLLN